MSTVVHQQVQCWLLSKTQDIVRMFQVTFDELSQHWRLLTHWGRDRMAKDIFKRIFLSENIWILNTIWLKFVPKGPMYNNTALVQIMAWRWSGGKPLSEPMMALVGVMSLSLNGLTRNDMTQFCSNVSIHMSWWSYESPEENWVTV